uniref:Uncharacterized protein n=1 Tax=Oryza glaberrima TaxID=4538 RepID=I1PKS6_ORYGL
PHQLKLFRSELVGVRNSILKSVSRVVRPHPWCAVFGISTGETDIMGTAKNPIGFRCNECMKKDSSLHDQNQHMTNVPTDRSTCLKESSDNVHGATNSCLSHCSQTFQLMVALKLLISGGAAARKQSDAIHDWRSLHHHYIKEDKDDSEAHYLDWNPCNGARAYCARLQA